MLKSSKQFTLIISLNSFMSQYIKLTTFAIFFIFARPVKHNFIVCLMISPKLNTGVAQMS